MDSSSFHGAGHQAAHEVAAGDDVDEEGRQGGDDRAGDVDVVFLHAGRGVDEVVERDRHRHGSRRPEKEAPNRKSFQMLVNCQITVTTMIGPDDRQQDAAEDLEEAGAVDLRGPHQLGRERLVVVAEEQRREAETVDDVDQDQAR